MPPIIEVSNLAKRYRLGAIGATSLREEFSRYWDRARGIPHPDGQEFWALNDVSFEVQRGEVVGVIGRNGAGKSTLLKILSRITEPTRGKAILRGRVASLLEVGTGFHAELTGRENVFLNGAILGMTRTEVRRKFDEIVAFAEVEQFIDTPVKRYSSGLYVRLAFAVAAHLEPEILIIDEVLAVGDAAFQRKCLGKMQQVATGEGRTVLFVSHNTAALQNLCTRGLLLEGGKQRFYGSTADALSLYINSGGTTGGLAIDKQVAPPNCPIRCTKLTVNGNATDRVSVANSSEPLEIVTEVEVSVDTRLSLEIYLCDRYGGKLALCSPGHDASGADVHRLAPGCHRLTARIELPRLFRGSYFLDVSLVQPFVCRYINFPSAIEVIVDSTGLNWGRLFEDAGAPLGFMVLPGRVTAERVVVS